MVVVAVAVAVAGCGGAKTQSAGQPPGDFPVRVTTASFPATQRLAQQSVLAIAVRNTGSRAIPDIAVTLVDPRYGTAAEALATLIAPSGQGQPPIANRSRPVWVIDRAPGPCEYSCRQGGPGGATTADSNTWALGRLEPGATVRFEWHVTAVRAGRYSVGYTVAAALTGGRARAVAAAGGGPVSGRFKVEISSAVPRARVTASGKVVYSY